MNEVEMKRRTGRARSAAERQAAYAERQLRLSPLERALRRPAEEIYRADELALLARLRRLRTQLESVAASLNLRLRARLIAESVAPSTDPRRIDEVNRTLDLLSGHTFISLPRF